MIGIILAAGYATRLYPLTLNKAKALLPVSGRPIIDYIVDEMETVDDLDQIIVISNHRFADQFKAWAEQRLSGKMTIAVLDDGTTSDADKLGAIGDILFCIEKMAIDDDLLIIAGDNLFTYRLRDAWINFKQFGEDMILATQLPPQEDLRRFAVASIDENGHVTDFEEKPAFPKSDLAVFATYFYRRDTVPMIKQYLDEGNKSDAPGYFPAWLYKRKPLRLYQFNGLCIDIGTPEAYADVMTTFPPVRQ